MTADAPLTDHASVHPSADPALAVLEAQRDRAERLLNAVRAAVLLLLGGAALAYAPSLTPALNRVNVLVLAPMLAWTLAQYLLLYRRPRLPGWLALANPIVDVTAVTAVLGLYALAQPGLGVKTPMFLAYFVVLAARPITSSTHRAAVVSALIVAEFVGLVIALVGSGVLPLTLSPIVASTTPAVSILDEGARLLLLGVAGAIATYATDWQERLLTRYSQSARDRERLEARLAQVQLQTLKLQLQPHFLFNTLNTITALIHSDRVAAERMVSGLSELLRLTLHNAGEHEVPLARELEVLEHYVDILRVRFQDRLSVSYAIDDEARSALVPNLILQPLVENAIRHGVAPSALPAHIEIRASRVGERLELRVEDDGVGVRAGGHQGASGGLGLENTRARLHSLYGAHSRFEARGGRSGGFTVAIELPFRPSAVVELVAAETAEVAP
jgi:two-component system, LytTR family, sensor kinase